MLLVDDQPARLLSYEAVLTGLGVNCVRALSGAAALAAILNDEFAAVLLDVQMPEMDGFEVARLLREHPRCGKTPIIFVTGVHVSELDQLKGYQAGAIDYIGVPVVPEILRSKVAVLVELFLRRRELAAVNEALLRSREQLAAQHAQALASAETQLGRLFEHPTDNMSILRAERDSSGRISDWVFQRANANALRFLGHTCESLLGASISVLGARASKVAALARQALETGESVRYEDRVGGRDFLITMFALDDTCVVSSAVDITAQRSAEEKLRESEQRFRELANNIDQLAFTGTELGVGDWFNDRLIDYTGFTFEELRGTGWTKALHPAHVERVSASIKRCVAKGEPWEDGFPLRGTDGEYRWFLSRATPIRDDEGRITRWLGTNTDVTELRRLEEALKETSRRKDEFLAMLSHELRNPIAPIRNAAELLSRLVANDERQLEMVGIIQRQAQHLSRLLDDLLEVARITQGRIELRHEILPLAECIALAVETVEPLIRENGHKLIIRHEPQGVYLNVDRARIVLCMANILSNAAKYTPANGRISIQSHVEDGLAIIEVIDNGIGIAADLLPRIFDIFVQGAQSLDRSRGGLGIGLAVCKRLIEMHGGSISTRSGGEGRGAAFIVKLPLAEKPAPVSTAAGSVTSAKALRILIVDDNRDAADSLAELLQIDGHTLRAVYSAEAGIDGLSDFRPDVVLLDIGLPGMDGYVAARRMRQLLPAARLIALTGYGRAEDRKRAQEAGFHSHLLKPVDPTALGELLEQHGN